MVSYTKDELLSITDFTKSVGKILNSIKDNSLKKVGILRNNRLEAVVISTQEYEKLKEIEEIFETIEDEEIGKTIEERKKTPKSEYVSLKEMADKFNIDLEKI